MTRTTSYLAIAQMAENETLRNRIKAALAQEMLEGRITQRQIVLYPDQWVKDKAYVIASHRDWAEAWTRAQEEKVAEADGVYDPGTDGEVITDEMILTAIQNLLRRPQE